jgi:dGTPase
MIVENNEPTIFKRHPFVWLVEAADDICYNIIDMEDAHRLGIISTHDCENLFVDLIKSVNEKEEKKVKDKLANLSNANERISYLRAKVINALITNQCLYEENFETFLNGTQDKALLDIFKKESASFQKLKVFPSKNLWT